MNYTIPNDECSRRSYRFPSYLAQSSRVIHTISEILFGDGAIVRGLEPETNQPPFDRMSMSGSANLDGHTWSRITIHDMNLDLIEIMTKLRPR